MRVQFDDVIFAYSMEDIFVSGGNRYLRDYGPNGFHMRFPGGVSDPTPTLFGSLSFDGNDYLYYDGDLTRYYAKMPTGPYTTSYITLIPRGGYLGQMSYYQGEMLSHELGI